MPRLHPKAEFQKRTCASEHTTCPSATLFKCLYVFFGNVFCVCHSIESIVFEWNSHRETRVNVDFPSVTLNQTRAWRVSEVPDVCTYIAHTSDGWTEVRSHRTACIRSSGLQSEISNVHVFVFVATRFYWVLSTTTFYLIQFEPCDRKHVFFYGTTYTQTHSHSITAALVVVVWTVTFMCAQEAHFAPANTLTYFAPNVRRCSCVVSLLWAFNF